MKKNLVIVESPAKAKTLSRILGKEYNLKASMGHVRDLPKGAIGVDIENSFAPKYVVPRTKSKLVKELKEAAKTAAAVYLATD
ncbi:MAG: toprim domain-containing protein, partial [Dehalococcoidales bacterium]|nr:toprim domain-containing protein [Dehalococcoidales bacterium]